MSVSITPFVAAMLVGFALTVAAPLAGGGLFWPAPGELPRLALVILTHPSDPGAAVGTPWSLSLAGRPGLF